MKLIHSNYEILEQGNGLDGINEQIELAGRTCYKSEPKYRYWSEDGKRFLNKDTEDFKRFYSEKEYPIQENISAKAFVDRMINSGHMAMLEHGTVYLKQDCDGILNQINPIWEKYEKNKYSKVIYYSGLCDTHIKSDLLSNTAYITTNYRVLVENNWLDDLQYLCEPTEYHEKRVTAKFTCDTGVSNEFIRFRAFSFVQEPVSYCNYSKGKFDNELTFVIPYRATLTEGSYNDNLGNDYTWQSNEEKESLKCNTEEDLLMSALNKSEQNYLELLKKGWRPQQARAILPNALKTELVMAGFVSDWKRFFKLLDDHRAHKDAQALAKPLREELKKKGYIYERVD